MLQEQTKSFVGQVWAYSDGVEHYKDFPIMLKKELMHLAAVELCHIALSPELGGPENIDQWFIDKAKEIISRHV